jgi:hypothetical protein
MINTADFINTLLDNCDPSSLARPRLIPGSYIPLLDEANAQASASLEQRFGTVVPENILKQDYTLTSSEKKAAGLFVAEYYEKNDIQTLVDLGLYTNFPWTRRALMGEVASEFRLHHLRNTLSYAALQPDLLLSEEIDKVPELLNTADRINGQAARSLECALTVFGMNAINFLNGCSPGKEFDSSTASTALNQHPACGERAKFDLPWLTNLLSCKVIEEQSGHSIRTAVTVGADLGEIEQRVLAPLRKSAPDVRFVINAVLASEKSSAANHMVVITKTTENTIKVQDPGIGKTSLSPERFWERWVPTNLQSVITIARPL